MNRRNFIKNTSLTLSSIGIAPSFLNEELDFCKKKQNGASNVHFTQ